MSNTEKDLMKIYDDIDLCYKVMGLSFSDPPHQVDRVYKRLIDEYSQKLTSGDMAVRKEAQENLVQTKDLYERITGSMIYRDYAREYEKYKELKEAQRTEKQQKAEAEKNLMVNCPFCKKLISPKLKACLYCHGKILSPFEMVLHKMFSGKNAIITIVVVLVVAAGVFLAINPKLLK